MWRSLRRRIGTLPLAGRLLPAVPEQEIAGFAVLFDRDWYLARNSDVPAAQSDPLRHFLDVGGFEGRDPNPLFDCAWYLERNPDVRAAGFNPLVHFAKWGWREGRDPNPLFDTQRFLEANPEVESSGLDPLAYYLTHWRAGVRPPTPIFRNEWYLEHYPDVRAAGVEPLGHYLSIGAGDAAFLEKANERLQKFIQKAGILVLASHAEELVRRFCDQAIVISHGRIICRDTIEEGLRVYRESASQPAAVVAS